MSVLLQHCSFASDQVSPMPVRLDAETARPDEKSLTGQWMRVLEGNMAALHRVSGRLSMSVREVHEALKKCRVG